MIERCSQKEKCAIIIDESHLDEFLTKGVNIIGECVNQIIIISENVNTALIRLGEVSVLLVAAGSFEEAVRIAILGASLNKEIVCILKEDEKIASDIIDVIMT